MQQLSKSQKARHAIRTFKTLADSVVLQGSYRPLGKVGQKLSDALRQLSPEIYGSMTDDRIVELKGLEYVIDRMPRGIENCKRIILTAQEDFHDTSFEKIMPLKRRRISFAVSDQEICFVVTRGKSEIYDILTHITFLNIEAYKIHSQICHRTEGVSSEWAELERLVTTSEVIEEGEKLEQAIWNLSIILGRTYKETRETYDYLENGRVQHGTNSGLFHIVYGVGKRVMAERLSEKNELTVYFTPSLLDMIDHQKYASIWAKSLKDRLLDAGVYDRPVHIISANMHSIRNLLYGAGTLAGINEDIPDDIYDMVRKVRDKEYEIRNFAKQHGFVFVEDKSGSNIDANIIDLATIDESWVHPALTLDYHAIGKQKPLVVVMDYAFGNQAYEIMDELLNPVEVEGQIKTLQIASISIMGKAGVLPGQKGDIMLATAHVLEGTANNYIVDNYLKSEDFPGIVTVYKGPMLTVLGTSLQNRDVLERFYSSSWKAVGLEMEGGHYQKAISGAIIRGHIQADIKTLYAYYASDNPMLSGQTLASGPMGDEGVVPTYMISKIILEKITSIGGAEQKSEEPQ
ncbi:DUF6909 family protein [Desulforhopalus singaporensis]|uniref:Uncharacterized protein n=1 Tax=Desulforhopalus singaporensis TaxID=91360 RepID=A0A1H0PZG7_9BACT|nr:hypothetical protein [Desulforhopalus singaporensis]SDP10135.1 hypothetical protein SAMN05660330_01815 [Desulforhopalus singaporensis]